MKVKIEKNPEERLSFEERKFRTGRNFAYHESSQPFYRVKILIKNLEEEPEIYVNKIEKKVYNIPYLIKFLEFFEDAGKGIAHLHSGAVANKNKEGILFGAWQDVGKTTIAILLAKKGYYLLGDDGVNISSDGYIIRVQEKAGIFPHKDNISWFALSFKERFLRWFKYNFIKFPALGRFVYPNIRIDYEKIGKTLKKAPLKKIFIFEKGNPQINEIDKETAIIKFSLTSLTQILPEGFPKRFFYAYCFANNISPTLIHDRYKEILSSAFGDKRIFLIKGKNPFDIYKLFLENEKNQS